MRILVDMDEVLVSFLEKSVYYVNNEAGLNLQVEDIKTWDLPNRDAFERVWRIPGFFADLPWEDDFAKQVLREWRARGEDVRIVTSPAVWEACADKYRWVHTHLRIPGLIPSMSKLILTRDKEPIRGDVMIDDGPHNLESFDGVRIVYDKPWNEHYEGADFRVHFWTDIWTYYKSGALQDRILRTRRLREEHGSEVLGSRYAGPRGLLCDRAQEGGVRPGMGRSEGRPW